MVTSIVIDALRSIWKSLKIRGEFKVSSDTIIE